MHATITHRQARMDKRLAMRLLAIRRVRRKKYETKCINKDGNLIIVPTQILINFFFFFSSRRRHTRFDCDWSSDVCSSDLISAGRLALNLPDLPASVRARHLACLFHNLVTAGRIEESRAVLDETRAAVASTDDARGWFTLRVAESALEYADDRFDLSVELITSAYRDGIFAGDDQRLRLAHMWHGELLSVADRYEEAFAIAADGLAAAQRDRQGWAYQMFETWHGRMLLRAGRLSEARAVLEGRFALEDGTHAAAVLDAAGIVALGRLAIHTGDARQARRLGEIGRAH